MGNQAAGGAGGVSRVTASGGVGGSGVTGVTGKGGAGGGAQPRLHPRQVRLDITMSNGGKNACIFTLHAGDYSFVQNIQIEGIEVDYIELDPETVARRKDCITQESGHKVPKETIRKADGRLVGSCSKCYERVNIERFPGMESAIDVEGILRQALFEGAGDELLLEQLDHLEALLTEEADTVRRGLEAVADARALVALRVKKGPA